VYMVEEFSQFEISKLFYSFTCYKYAVMPSSAFRTPPNAMLLTSNIGSQLTGRLSTVPGTSCRSACCLGYRPCTW